jgi:hypothetical protein
MTVDNMTGSFSLEYIDIVAGKKQFLFLADHFASEGDLCTNFQNQAPIGWLKKYKI